MYTFQAILVLLVSSSLLSFSQAIIDYDSGGSIIRVAEITKSNAEIDESIVAEPVIREILALYQNYVKNFDPRSFESGKNRNYMVHLSIPKIQTSSGSPNVKLLLVDRKTKTASGGDEIYLLFVAILDDGEGLLPKSFLHLWRPAGDGYRGTVVYE